MTPEYITIDLICKCGKKCGELAISPADPRGTDLKAHGIEKVECDECVAASKKSNG